MITAGKDAKVAYQVRDHHRDNPSDTNSGQVSSQHFIVTTGGCDIDDGVELSGSNHPCDDAGDKPRDGSTDTAPLVRL